MELIPYTDVIRLMHKTDHAGQPVPFSLKVVTCDRNRQKGGDILIIDKAIVSRQKGKSNSSSKRKTPRHYDNATRNIQLIPSMEIRKIHPRLITEFNKKQVFY